VPVDPKGTSQKCSRCGGVVKKSLGVRVHACAYCGLVLNRDHNAALNVLALGRSAVGNAPKGLATHIRPLPSPFLCL
jgi:putative transposase